MVAVGERNTRGSRSALCGTDAGHGFTGDADSGQGLGLFAATAENVGKNTEEGKEGGSRISVAMDNGAYLDFADAPGSTSDALDSGVLAEPD